MTQLPWVTVAEEMPPIGTVVLVGRDEVFAGWLMYGWDGKYRWGRYTPARGLEYVGEAMTTDRWVRIPDA